MVRVDVNEELKFMKNSQKNSGGGGGGGSFLCVYTYYRHCIISC